MHVLSIPYLTEKKTHSIVLKEEKLLHRKQTNQKVLICPKEMFILKKVVNIQPLSYRELYVRCYCAMPRPKYALKTLSSSCKFPNIVSIIPNKFFYFNGNLYPWSNIFTKRYMATKKGEYF